MRCSFSHKTVCGTLIGKRANVNGLRHGTNPEIRNFPQLFKIIYAFQSPFQSPFQFTTTHTQLTIATYERVFFLPIRIITWIIKERPEQVIIV